MHFVDVVLYKYNCWNCW